MVVARPTSAGRRSGSRSAIPSGTAAAAAGRSSARSAWPSRRPAPRGGRTSPGSSRPRSGAPRRRPSAAGSRRRAGCRPSPWQSTIVSPEPTTTAPLAWRASLPVSKEISSPPTSTETRLTSNMLMYFFPFGRPVGGHLAQNFSFSLAARCYRASDAQVVLGRAGAASTNAAGVPVTPARIPPSKSRAHPLGDRARSGGRARSAPGRARARAPAPTGAGRPPCPGRDRSSPRAPERLLAPERRRPRPRRGAPGRAGACWPPGSGGRRAAGAARRSAPRSPRSAGRRGPGRRPPPARRRGRGRSGHRPARDARRWSDRHALRLRPVARHPRPWRSSVAAASASKIRLAPGISSGVGDSCTQRTIPSSSIRTSERLPWPTLVEVGAVARDHLSLGLEVGEQRDRDPELLPERPVGPGRVDAHADQGRALLLDLRQHLLVDRELVGAHRAEVERVEDQHQLAAPEVRRG